MKMKPETVKKYMDELNARIAYYMTMDPYRIPLCISDGNDKIGHALNVSQPAIKRAAAAAIAAFTVMT